MPSLSFENVASFCPRLDLSGDVVEVDLSRFDFVEPGALVYFGMLLRSRAASTSFRQVRVRIPHPG
jgi:hypothetical protein